MSRLIDGDALAVDIKECIEVKYENGEYEQVQGLEVALECIDEAPTIEPERKWETCFDCPLSNGCPKIRGCTNEQAEGYASGIPDDCPLSIEPERKKGE